MRLAPLAIIGALTFAACGDDDDDAADAAAAETTAAPTDTTAHADHPSVVVDGIDYGFENLPDEVPAGTMLTFRNTSDEEFHEMVVDARPR